MRASSASSVRAGDPGAPQTRARCRKEHGEKGGEHWGFLARPPLLAVLGERGVGVGGQWAQLRNYCTEKQRDGNLDFFFLFWRRLRRGAVAGEKRSGVEAVEQTPC